MPVAEDTLVRGLLGLASTLASEAPVAERMSALCRATVELLGCDRSSLFLLEAGYYRATYNYGNPPDIAARFHQHRVRLHDPLIAQAMAVRDVVIVNDTAHSELMHQRTAKVARIRAIVVAPLFDESGQPQGFLTAEFNERQGAFSQMMSALVLGFAKLAELALVAEQRQQGRRQAEAALDQRLRLEELIATISTNFITLAGAEIDGGIHRALQAIGEFAGVDRSYIIELAGDGLTMDMTYEWHVAEVEPRLPASQHMPVASFAWMMAKLARFEPVYVPRAEELPPEAAGERALARARGFRSLVAVPMVSAGALTGSLGFVSRQEKHWPADTLALLNLAAGMFVNALERKRAEQALRANEERFRALVENSADAIALWDAAGNVLYVSANNWRIFGRAPETEIGRHWAEDVHPEDLERCQAAFAEVLSHPGELVTCQLRMRHGDGSWHWIEGTGCNLLGNPSVRAIVVNSRDITERKRAEQAQARLAAILEATPDFVGMAYPDRQAFYINRGGRKMLGISEEENVVGTTVPDYSPPWATELILREGIPAAIRDGVWSGETALRHRDGREIPVSQVILAHRADSGAVEVLSTIARDISERKRAEAAVRSMNAELEQRVAERTAQLEAANKELEAFCYSVAHDLRTPLRGINGFSQVLLEDYGTCLDKVGQGHLHRIRAASERMGRLIDDLLGLSQVSRKEMQLELVDLSGLAHAIAAELYRSSPHRQVTFAIEGGLCARGDERLLRVALDNLMGNAWKYTSKHATARIEFGRLPVNNSEQTGTGGEQIVTFFVRDDGAGFDMNFAGKLFGAFQRLHGYSEFEGTGIGLATVQRVIQRHGGRVWARGAVEKGATFFFTLMTA